MQYDEAFLRRLRRRGHRTLVVLSTYLLLLLDNFITKFSFPISNPTLALHTAAEGRLYRKGGI